MSSIDILYILALLSFMAAAALTDGFVPVFVVLGCGLLLRAFIGLVVKAATS